MVTKQDNTNFKDDMLFEDISYSLPQVKKATCNRICGMCGTNIYKGDRAIVDKKYKVCVRCMPKYLSKQERKVQLVKDSITKGMAYVKKNKKGWLKEQMINRLEG